MARLKAKADSSDKHNAQTQVEAQRILAAMTAHNESAQHRPEVFAALQQSFETQQGFARQHTAASLEAKNAIADGRMHHAASLSDAMRPSVAKLDELATAIRAELGLEAVAPSLFLPGRPKSNHGGTLRPLPSSYTPASAASNCGTSRVFSLARVRISSALR